MNDNLIDEEVIDQIVDELTDWFWDNEHIGPAISQYVRDQMYDLPKGGTDEQRDYQTNMVKTVLFMKVLGRAIDRAMYLGHTDSTN